MWFPIATAGLYNTPNTSPNRASLMCRAVNSFDHLLVVFNCQPINTLCSCGQILADEASLKVTSTLKGPLLVYFLFFVFLLCVCVCVCVCVPMS